MREHALRAAMAAARRSERTLAVEIAVEQFLDRVEEALNGGQGARLALWLDRTFDRYGDRISLGPIFSAAWDALRAARNANGTPLATIGAVIDEAVARPRRLLRIDSPEPLDEIDASLGELIGRLFDHDPITAEHSRAVSSWCARIARKLGLSPSETLLMKRGGLAHDLGKVGTPEEILYAPRALTPDEWVVMRRHTTDGADIVADVPLLVDFLPAIRSHHERIDGKGYPDGLRGEEIPFSARVVAVADCFNAMIGRRPYRPPMAPSRALEQLQRSAGDHLDPEVVDAMIAVVTARPDAAAQV